MAVLDAEPEVMDRLAVHGELPVELAGSLVQALPNPRARHPLAGPLVHSGVRLGGGAATWYREPRSVCRKVPFGPIPALAPSLWLDEAITVARPVLESQTGHWHTVAAYQGLGYAEHLTAAPDGTVLRAVPFPLSGSPFISSVALTERFLLMVDPPVAYHRAAALVGVRLPYQERVGRRAFLGLLPRCGAFIEPVWAPLGRYQEVRTLRAAEDGYSRVTLDAVCRNPGEDAHQRRFTVDLLSGRISSRRLTGVHAVVACGSTVSGAGTWDLGPGWTAGQPVMVGAWVLLFGHNAVTRQGALFVLPAGNLPAGPTAWVELPVSVGVGDRVAWLR
ncbi:hypothetical protein [Acrocarpospora catenulata]|uniref:hypothetical protein n=1 Tax=Acrocarpospora catenulata TaxID=2836182 RepID=UPI001BDABE01|nr:hypothetical protein [Acrocarpospora catenulata]